MGNIYIVQPLTEEVTGYLDTESIPYPNFETPRFPTPDELWEVLDGLEGFTVGGEGMEYGFIASSDPAHPDWWTVLKEDNDSDGFIFSKGAPEVVFIVVERVAAVCGPLVVIDAAGSCPVVVSPGDSLEDLMQRYLSPWPNDEGTDS
jgi:hypothetical protein